MNTINKKLFVFSCLILVGLIAQATVLTVDNKVNAGSDFSSLAEAVAAAAAGDTLYIAGSPTTYGNVTVNRKITLIGNGYRINTGNIWDHITTVGTITFADNTVTNPTDSYITGLRITGNTFFNDGTGYMMDRCHASNVYGEDNVSLTIRNCIVNSLVFSNSSNFGATVKNSIITGGLNSYANPSGVIVDHCLFVNYGIEYINVEYATITNSIIYLESTAGARFTNFQNNISYAGTGGTETSFDTGDGGDNSGGGNFENQDPMFTSATGDFSFNNDYRLQEGSPGKNAAIDGSDIGIYGGDYPFPIGGDADLLMAAQPRIPYIYEMNIANPSVAEDGTLNVNIKATKKD